MFNRRLLLLLLLAPLAVARTGTARSEYVPADADGQVQEPAGGQSIDPIRAGTIIPVVVTRAEPDQTYALYLPSFYSPGRKWPVIYAFDPTARGQLPIERFKEAAEKYGYILAASNTSRNGPVPPSVRAGLAMLRDTLDRFSIGTRSPREATAPHGSVGAVPAPPRRSSIVVRDMESRPRFRIGGGREERAHHRRAVRSGRRCRAGKRRAGATVSRRSA